MAYIKDPTEEQREEWHRERNLQEKQMEEMIQNLAESWQDHPETIAEALSFGSRMYQYSLKNNMLIYAQNPYATYVQSYQAWKNMGASVKKGEKGYKVWVPVQATILKIDGKLVPLEHATEEQKVQYRAGEIESITQHRYRLGTVFDISQTTYPKERYPELFHMGYESTLHGGIVKGLMEYSANVLQCPVTIADLKSISLRGYYKPADHFIRINELLEDTQQLSTLSHELGHALQHHETQKSTVQKELEADAFGILLESHFGIEPTDTRKSHLAEHYREYEKAWKEQEGLDSFGQVLTNVFAVFKREIPEITKYVEAYLPARPVLEQKQTTQRESYDIYDKIKQDIRILDYASIHGIQLKRVGRYYTMQEHDSVRIDPDRNCFWRNSGVGNITEGSVIDFAAVFVHGEDLHEALSELSSLAGTSAITTQWKKQQPQREVQERRSQSKDRRVLKEELPKRAKNMHRAYAYLTQTRYIDQDVVQDFVNRKMLYQDVRGNCVFVSYDSNQNPVFASFRGTLSEVKFLGDVPGSDYQQGFYIDNGSTRVIVTESVIDAMSVMSILKGQGLDYKAYDYLPLNGTGKYLPLVNHLQKDPKEEVLLALDHDLAGVKDMQLIHDSLMEQLGMADEQISYHVPEKKDWNMDLTEKAGKFQSLEEIPFLEEAALPKIHYCAVQSTEHYEERGFHKRNGKDQYRLVELLEDGRIASMDIKKNVIFRTPEEVKKLVPNMYEELKYEELLKRQAELQRDPAFSIKGFSVSEGMLVARTVYNGMESEESIWKGQDRFYVATGYEMDHTYKEHDLTEPERQELEQYIKDNGIEIDETAELLILKSAYTMPLEKKGTSYLDQLQEQEFHEEEMNVESEMVIGMG